MERVRTQEFAEQVDRGRALIPERVLERIGPVHFFEGDIRFSGAVSHDLPSPHYATAWSPLHFRDRPADRRCQTVCFTGVPWEPHFDTKGVIHEAGHCLQYALGSFPYAWGWPHYNLVGLPDLLGPVSRYAEDDYSEQFCEAMCAWLCPPEDLEFNWTGVDPVALLSNGAELLAFFNKLAGWPVDQLPRALRS